MLSQARAWYLGSAVKTGRRSSLAAAFLAGLAWFHIAAGPLLAHLEWVDPIFGFMWLFCFGFLEGLVALVSGAISLYRQTADSPFRGIARFGFGGGLAACILGFTLGALAPTPSSQRSATAAFDVDASAAYAAAIDEAYRRSFTILDEDEFARTFTADATTRIFRFADRIEVRAEPDEMGTGSELTIEVRSRESRGPFSSDAKAFSRFFEALR